MCISHNRSPSILVFLSDEADCLKHMIFGISKKRRTYGCGVETAVLMADDPLSRLYNLSLAYRPSCYSCAYTSTVNDFDFTIGDFWEVEKCHPQFADGRGTSLVIAHGERAEDIISRSKQNAEIISGNGESVMQPALTTPAREPFLRKFLFRDFAHLKEEGKNPIPLILKKFGGVLTNS